MAVDPSTLGIKSLPMLRGAVEWPSADGSRVGLSSWRVTPLQLGCLIRADSTGSTLYTSGVGQLGESTTPYVMVATAVSYGLVSYFIPDYSRIARVVSVDDANYEITIDRDLDVQTGDFLINLGDDTSIAPFTSPSFDGAGIEIYNDNTGQVPLNSPYTLSSVHGFYRMWLESGIQVVDLLLLDTQGNARLLEPFVRAEVEIV